MAGEKAKIDPFAHVVDSDHIEIFPTAGIEIHGLSINGVPLKFMILMTISALLVVWMMLWLAKKMRTGEPPRGVMWNLLESLLFFVRDKIARAGVGEKDGDKFLPYLTTLFLFIFMMNLMGMIPFLGSPTAGIMVTGALALISFVVIHISGVQSNGFGGYLKTFIPHIHLEGGAFMKLMEKTLVIGMAVLEYMTAFIRASVLAVRLFANMLAGHTVLYMILLFIVLVTPDPANLLAIPIAQDWMYWPMALFSVTLVVLLSVLELFIAGLQAFIFTFLTAVFIGLAKHPPH